MALQRALFRQQAVDFQRYHRQWGEVALPQPVSTRVLSWGLALIVAVGLVYLSAAQFSRKQTVAGYLRPATGTLKVYPVRSGTISAVYVRQGEAVRQGQPLFSVSTPLIADNGVDLNAAKLAVLGREKTSLRDEIATEQRRAQSERARFAAEIASAQSEIMALRQQIQIQAQRIAIAKNLVQAARTLLAQGDISIVTTRKRQDQLLNQEQMLDAMQRQVLGKQNTITGARYALAELPTTTAGKVQRLRDQIADVDQRIADIHAQQAYVVRAPASGHITALPATVGQAVDPQHMQLAIVARGAPLQAILYIPTRAIGFMRVGQRVKLRYDAFPYQNFGTHDGHIVKISRTVLTRNDETGPIQLKEPVYEAVVRLDQAGVDAYGKKMPLKPDMLLKADVILSKLSLMQWLIDPLLAKRP